MTSFRVLKADPLNILHVKHDLLFLNKPAHLSIYDVNSLEVYDFDITYAAVWDRIEHA